MAHPEATFGEISRKVGNEVSNFRISFFAVQRTKTSNRNLNFFLLRILIMNYFQFVLSSNVTASDAVSDPEIPKFLTTAEPNRNRLLFFPQWRQLTSEVKQSWEEKAAKMNEEMKEAKALEDAMHPHGTPVPNPPNLPSSVVFECVWDNCDYQFDDLNDCLEHAVAEGNGHVQMYFAAVPPSG